MRSGLLDLLRTSLLIIGALFPIVNPLGNAPIFLALTWGFSSSKHDAGPKDHPAVHRSADRLEWNQLDQVFWRPMVT
jgi:hypothetical protein